MSTARLPANDPRTVARDIPGLLDNLFPQLTPGLVAYFNRGASSSAGCAPVAQSLINRSGLQRAMLFELAVAAGEQLIAAQVVDWDRCLAVALARQRRHFDAKLPLELSTSDKDAAFAVALNLATMMDNLRADSPASSLVHSPAIPGYQWIASGNGDFALDAQLIEVKCANKRFSSSDYRQVLMYWLLSYAATLERHAIEWTHAILVNPRLNLIVKLPFQDIIAITSAERSKVELLELFVSMVGERVWHQTRFQ